MDISGFAGSIIDAAHEDYDNARTTWNGMIDQKPAAIAMCSSVDDVVAAVRYAAATGMTAAARCGGHSVSGASTPEGGLVIDLSALNAVDVDPNARIAQVGGGALLGDLDAAAQEHGLAVTAGVEPETGVGGLTLGGGIGFLARKLGLSVDNLVGAEMVLADGTITYSDKDTHPDLFWAIRGGGGQFGIVTRFDFQVHPIGPNIVVSHAYYPLEKARQVMRYVREFMHNASDEVAMLPAFMKIPAVDPFPIEWHGEPCAVVVSCHVGEHSAAKAELQPLLEKGDLIFGFLDEQPYLEFQKTFGGASPKGGRFYWKSIFFDDLTDDLVDLMVEGIQTLPGEYTLIFTEALGGAVGRIGVEDTAFSNRTARYNMGLSAGWVDPNDDEAIIAASRAWFEKLKPFSDGTVYLNYLDRDELSRAQEGFGANYKRLKRVKQKYDPNGVFAGALTPD